MPAAQRADTGPSTPNITTRVFSFTLATPWDLQDLEIRAGTSVKAPSLNRWTAREFPSIVFKGAIVYCYTVLPSFIQ